MRRKERYSSQIDMLATTARDFIEYLQANEALRQQSYDSILVQLTRAVALQAERQQKPILRDAFKRGLVTNIPVVVTVVGGLLVFILALPNVSSRINAIAAPQNDQNVALSAGQIRSITASSFLSVPSRPPLQFSPRTLLDDNPATAWIECGTSEAPRAYSPEDRRSSRRCFSPLGAFVTIRLIAPVDVKSIDIRDGVEVSQHEFLRHPRVRVVDVALWEGTSSLGDPPTEDLLRELSDDEDYQPIDVNRERVSAFRITIRSVYAGEDQAPDGDARTVANKASVDAGLSDVKVIPAKLTPAVMPQHS